MEGTGSTAMRKPQPSNARNSSIMVPELNTVLSSETPASSASPAAMQRRVAGLAGSRLTKEGVIVITSNSHRDQPLNRAEALARLVALLREGAYPPKPRIATRPTLASKRRRLESKARRSSAKKLRQIPDPDT